MATIAKVNDLCIAAIAHVVLVLFCVQLSSTILLKLIFKSFLYSTSLYRSDEVN